MADATIQLPPDSTGKKLRVFGPLADGSFVEGVAITDANGDQLLAPESPKIAATTSVNLAAGASVDLETPDITTGTTGNLEQVTIAASVPLKAEIKTRDGAAIALRDTVFTSEAHLTQIWRGPNKKYVTQVGGTTRRFRVTLTSLDNIDAADVYVTFFYDEVT